MPKLSVIVPVYNAEKSLSRCVDSILAQTFTDFELILVNDGSSDSSAILCDAYAAENPKIKTIHKNENTGPLHTRKVGFEQASGEYISYIDSDDYIHPSMYEIMMKPIVQYRPDIVICGIMMESEVKSIPLCSGAREGIYDKARLVKEIYPFMLYSPANGLPLLSPSLCNKIFRREILQKPLADANNKIYYGEDAVCSYPCILDADKIYMLPNDFLYFYCITQESLTNMYDKHFFAKLPVLISELEHAFDTRNFYSKTQIDCYAAVQLLEAVRKELLFNTDLPLNQRIKKVREYIQNPRLNQALFTMRQQKVSQKIRYKLYLLQTEHIFLLYGLFFLKYRLTCRSGKQEKT